MHIRFYIIIKYLHVLVLNIRLCHTCFGRDHLLRYWRCQAFCKLWVSWRVLRELFYAFSFKKHVTDQKNTKHKVTSSHCLVNNWSETRSELIRHQNQIERKEFLCLFFRFFMPRHKKSDGVLCYTLWNFECPSIRPSVRQRPHHSSARNSSYSFRPILFKLFMRF